MKNVYIMEHPLIQHKISMLRDENTGTNEFRKLVEEIGILMGYEALRDLPTENVTVKTPLETCETPMISGKKLAVVPVLRAGLGMVNSILTLVPSAKVGHIGLYRDPETHEPHEYYCKLPESIDERITVVVDPMLATGGSAVEAVDFIKAKGGRNIKFMCIIAAPRRSGKIPCGASGRAALLRTSGQMPQRPCVHLPGTGRCGRPDLRNEVGGAVGRRCSLPQAAAPDGRMSRRLFRKNT